MLGTGMRAASELRRMAPGLEVKEGMEVEVPIWSSWVIRTATGRAMVPMRGSMSLIIRDIMGNDRKVGCIRVGSSKLRASARKAAQQVVDACREGGRFTVAGQTLPQWSEWSVREVMVSCAQWNWYEARQREEVWQAFQEWPVEGSLREFVWVVLWKKLPVKKRLVRMGMVPDGQCVWGDGEEDVLHVVKGCCRLRWWFEVVYRTLGNVGEVEVSRLVVDNPVLSLRTAQGALVWAGLWASWNNRNGVTFGRESKDSHYVYPLVAFVRKWESAEQLGLTLSVREEIAKGIESWWWGVPPPPLSVPVRAWRRKRRRMQ
jgi:hypothetical protein